MRGEVRAILLLLSVAYVDGLPSSIPFPSLEPQRADSPASRCGSQYYYCIQDHVKPKN
jgi:hypothetical protein